jgi:ABC-type uncharacterized transport system permease subunit
MIFLAWFWIFKTRSGLMLQGIGERPAAAFVRGANVQRMRYFYTILGGALVGLAGPIYTLSVKPGWKGTITGLDGIGWIVLAITIFGGWNPGPSSAWSLFVCTAAVVGLSFAADLYRHSFSSFAGGAFPTHDLDPTVRQSWQY